MKIKTKTMPYERVMALPAMPHKRPRKPSFLFHSLMRLLSWPDLRATHFTYTKIGMEKLGKREPCLYLMNHSSFIDLKIASHILYPQTYNIVCTSDGLVGKAWLMRKLGCIPTKKFVPEVELVRDMLYALKTLKKPVLMYPEAGYSLDGTATTLPESLGRCLKMLGVPVVMIRTHGAFARDPLYNNLQLRRVPVSAEVEYILSPEDIKEKTAAELNEIIQEQFSFDNFKWQHEQHIAIHEHFRADHLNRVLYKCPHCQAEGKMVGKDKFLTCTACGKQYKLRSEGEMIALEGETEFPHIPDWFRWQRECVKRELEEGTYHLDVPVKIGVLVDTKAMYMVGEGRLVHSMEGFHLTGCDGKLDYVQKPLSSYTLNADYYFYEIGDMISIGNQSILFFCFTEEGTDVVTKTRLATEELYKIVRAKVRHGKPAERH